MWCKKTIWVMLAFIALTAFVTPRSATQKWVITQNSNLSVNGTTNINKFTCDIPSYGQTDTITIAKGENGRSIVLSGSIGLKIQSFDCHNAMMTRDLRKTLKGNQYPILQIRFLSLSSLPALTSQPEHITGLVDIEIAGISKQFEINYQISVDEQKTIHLVGSREVNFSDFDLIPPRKLGGMIKTNDQLSVTFHLKINPIR